jgi:hypothetical protein
MITLIYHNLSSRLVGQLYNDQVQLESISLTDLPSCQTFQATSDKKLLKYLFQSHAVLSFTMDGSRYLETKCLAPPSLIAPATQSDHPSSTFISEPVSNYMQVCQKWGLNCRYLPKVHMHIQSDTWRYINIQAHVCVFSVSLHVSNYY